MRVTFVVGAHELIGAEYVSASLRREGIGTASVQDPELFRDVIFVNRPLGRLFSRRAEVVREVVETRPDLVAFSIATPNLPWALEIASGVRAAIHAGIVFGGIHPSAVPERILVNDCVDYAIVGEGEEAIVDLVRGIEAGGDGALASIPNLWRKQDGTPVGNPVRPLLQDLDSLPYPDKDLYYRHLGAYSHCYKIAAARGCPHRCTFCYHAWWREIYRKGGAYVRRRSLDSVIDELKEAKRRYGCEVVRFNDEDLLHHKEWFLGFADRYAREVGLPFWCYVHPTSVDEERVRALKRAGCYRTEMGVQSLVAQTKQVLGREESNEQTIRAIDCLRAAGISLAVDNIFYVPGQTMEELVEMARFYNEHRADITQNAALHYFPRLPIIEAAKRNGILTEADERRTVESPAETMILYPHYERRRSVERLRTYMSLLLLLPRRVNDLILDHALWRFVPILHPILTFGLVSALRAPKEDRWYEIRHQERYRIHIIRRLWEVLHAGLMALASRRPATSPSGKGGEIRG